MSDDDFTLESLADYLHLDRAQVARLADRGKLPGHRVGGVWRFRAAEVHHWLEERIGASDDAQLSQMEGALERADAATEEEIGSLVSLMLPAEAIAIPLPARTKNSVIDEMVTLAARTGWLWDPPKMAAAVRSREEMHPTALENGVAFLHPRRPLEGILGRAFMALGRTETGIPFGGGHGRLTDIFFLICSVEDGTHLRVLARLSRLVTHATFLDELRAVPDAIAAHDLVKRVERELTG